MAEIIKFVQRPGAPPRREEIATARRPARNDRLLVLISHQRYWEAVAIAARQKGYSEQAQHFEVRAEALFEEIVRTKASTIEGAIAQLRFLFADSTDWVEVIAAGLSAIAVDSGQPAAAPPNFMS
jgi:hypothetical protein